MEFLVDLWLPIVLSAVAVFVLSSILHMATPLHKGDTRGLANEEAVLDVLRAGGLAPGEYMFPFTSDMKEMGSEPFRAKLDRGPVGFMQVVPNGPMNIGRSLVQWFLYSLVIGIFVAYVGHLALDPGAPGVLVFRVLASVAVLPYGLAHFHDYIWRGRSLGIVLKFAVSGLAYGLLTGALFAWFWPGA